MMTTPNERLIRSTPGSPTALIMGGGVQQSMDRQAGSFEVIGSAENLVGRVSARVLIFSLSHSLITPPLLQVLVEQGLGKYCDTDFVRYTSREMQEALEMTREEMDLAAHELLVAQQKNGDEKASMKEHLERM